MRPIVALVLSLACTLSAVASSRYHLELEAHPAAAFPYLSRFGAVDLHVYPAGVRAEALWLNAFSKNGAPAITVANPLGRMYVDLPLTDIAAILQKLAGTRGSTERGAAPESETVTRGTVKGMAATRHRLVYGPEAWIDVWTTSAIPENPQLRRIVDQLVTGISPGTARAARAISGTPIYVELNFRRFKKVPLLTLKRWTPSVSADEEKEALEIGAMYMRAPLLDRILQ